MTQQQDDFVKIEFKADYNKKLNLHYDSFVIDYYFANFPNGVWKISRAKPNLWLVCLEINKPT